jgi:hypothetical protein
MIVAAAIAAIVIVIVVIIAGISVIAGQKIGEGSASA